MRKITKVLAENQKVSVGLEVAKRTWKVAVRTNGRLIAPVSMPGDSGQLIQFLRDHFPGCTISVIYEAGFSGFWLHDRLVAAGFKCVVTPPHTVTQAKDMRVKTDKIDAIRLAKVLEDGDYKSCHVPSEKEREDRQISRALLQVQNDLVRALNRVRKFLDFHGRGIDLPAGRWTAKQYQQVRLLQFTDSLQVAWEILWKSVDHFREQKKELQKVLLALSKKEPYKETVRIFSSAPGIGWFTAIRLALEWGPLGRFKSGKEFSSFNGLVCSEYSTGDTIHRGRITGQGRGCIRRWLIECSWVAIKHDFALRKKFEAVWQHSSSKKKAIVAVARKLAVRLWSIYKSGEEYQLGVIQ
jgi:transposase